MEIKVLLVTSRSISFQLETDDNFFLKEELTLKYNGKEQRLTKVVNSIYDLEPNTEYILEIFKENIKVTDIKVTTDMESFTLNVKRFGAKGDGIHNDTLAIQSAIMACPQDGRVYIPRGKYLITSIFLKDHLTLELGDGVELLGDTTRENFGILPGLIDNDNNDEYYLGSWEGNPLDNGVELLGDTTRENFGILPGLIDNDNNDEYYLGSWEGNPLDSFTSLITGINVKNVKIIGRGTLNGNGSKENWWNEPKIKKIAWRPRSIFLNNCENVVIEGIEIKNSPSWTIHPFLTNNLRFINLKIENPADSPNTDGIDPESCENVEYIGIDFSVGDDCIAIKSGKLYLGRVLNKPSKNFYIRHCSMKYGHGGVVIGSEMSGGVENVHIEKCDFYKTEVLNKPSKNFYIRHCSMKYGHGGVVIGSEMSGGVENVHIEKCDFYKTDKGIRIKTRRGRGENGVIDGIYVENISMNEVKVPFVINCFYFCDPDGKTEYVYTKEKLPVDERTPSIKNIEFKNIKAENTKVCAGYLYGLPEKPIENVKFKDVEIDFTREEVTPEVPAMMSFIEEEAKTGLFIKNVDGISLENLEIKNNIGEKIRGEIK